jgi:alkylated DNA nucleotide flippase Atl1
VTPRKAKLDLDAAAAFLETVPEGSWTSYGDVAVAAGRARNAAQGIVSWIGSKGHLVANVHRVLNSEGEINPGWSPAGPGLPSCAADVERLLISEGLEFRNGRADPARRWRASENSRR